MVHPARSAAPQDTTLRHGGIKTRMSQGLLAGSRGNPEPTLSKERKRRTLVARRAVEAAVIAWRPADDTVIVFSGRAADRATIFARAAVEATFIARRSAGRATVLRQGSVDGAAIIAARMIVIAVATTARGAIAVARRPALPGIRGRHAVIGGGRLGRIPPAGAPAVAVGLGTLVRTSIGSPIAAPEIRRWTCDCRSRGR
jgi:hypothetical protein